MHWQIETETTAARKTSELSVRRVDNLQDRLDALKKKYLENEINVQKAEREADSATSLANRAEAVRYAPAHKVTINQFERG